MSKIALKVNGATHSLDIDPSTPLLYVRLVRRICG
jgi:aerobic-type carbon monoxide dehydrogenase small subunit (CoxS/CutS family)